MTLTYNAKTRTDAEVQEQDSSVQFQDQDSDILYQEHDADVQCQLVKTKTMNVTVQCQDQD